MEQAVTSIDGQTFGKTYIPDAFTEKFAELIVRECLDHIDTMERIAHASNASIPDDYDKYTYLKTLDVLKSLIKSQFGVKE